MSGYHDDLIDAARFAIWARDTAIRLESEKKRTAEKTVQNITTRKGQQGSPGKGIYSPTDPNTGEDLSWLYK
jgi:hypothetical protein